VLDDAEEEEGCDDEADDDDDDDDVVDDDDDEDDAADDGGSADDIEKYHHHPAGAVQQVQLVVVDSVAFHFRADRYDQTEEAAARTKSVQDMGSSLQSLAQHFNVAVRRRNGIGECSWWWS
jgi:RecA/RadA recombinase